MKKRHVSLLLILLLATGLRFYRLAGPSLWSDEGNSVALARLGFAEIAGRTAFDIHPPLYYWLLKIWVALFGFGEAAVRSFSAVLGVLVVMVVWLLARTMFDRRVSFAAAFAAAVSPLLVYYSQEARMYMLLTFLSSFAMWLGVRLLQTDSPRTGRLLALVYIVTVTAGLYTHYAFPLMLAALNLIAFPWFFRSGQLRLGNTQFRTWLVAQAIPLLLYLPWLPIAWRQLTTWPAAPAPASGGEVLTVICTTLLFGLTWPYSTDLLALGLLLIAVLVPLFLTGRAAQLLPPARRWVVMFPCYCFICGCACRWP
jgi:4-amino-4-deoxy-L-arabinose transferase-like glycosyltransferase